VVGAEMEDEEASKRDMLQIISQIRSEFFDYVELLSKSNATLPKLPYEDPILDELAEQFDVCRIHTAFRYF
jgi:hypothetical protein